MQKIITLIRARGLLNRAHGLLSRAHGLLNRAHGLIIRAHGLLSRAHGLARLNNYFPHGTAGAPYICCLVCVFIYVIATDFAGHALEP